MSDISKITLPNGSEYNLKDASAISSLAFSGHTITPTKRDGTTATPLNIGTIDELSVADLSVTDLTASGVCTFTNGLIGNLTGNADSATTAISADSATTATTATKAVQDESGNNIKSTYGVELSLSDHALSLKNKNNNIIGTTITLPDTWIAMVGATASDDGSAGYVPAPPSNGYNAKFLRADGTWTVPAQAVITPVNENIGSASNWSAGSLPTFEENDVVADEITSWDAGSAPTLGTDIDASEITSWNAGSVPTLGTDIDADDITQWDDGDLPVLQFTARLIGSASGWDEGEMTEVSYSPGTLVITNGTEPQLTITDVSCDDITSWDAGTLPTLVYTPKAIPNVTSVGTAPTLGYTAKTIPNVTSVGSAPVLTHTAKNIPVIATLGSLPTLTVTTKSVVTSITTNT